MIVRVISFCKSSWKLEIKPEIAAEAANSGVRRVWRRAKTVTQ
jgi:hypothetical protein